MRQIMMTMTQQPWQRPNYSQAGFPRLRIWHRRPVLRTVTSTSRGAGRHTSLSRSAEDLLEPMRRKPELAFEGGAFKAPAYTRRRLDMGMVCKYGQVYGHGYGQVCMERAAGGVWYACSLETAVGIEHRLPTRRSTDASSRSHEHRQAHTDPVAGQVHIHRQSP